MISIIIPTYNEEKFLPKLLKSIQNQTFKDYEVIVADAASIDKTVEIAQNFKCKIVKGGNPAHGRNEGAKVAEGEYLVFLDSDVVLPENFLKEAIEEFVKNYYEVASAQFIPISELNIDHLIYFFGNSVLKCAPKFYPFGSGPCMMATRRLHNKLNGFNENLRMAEDHDYVFRSKKFGKYGIIRKVKIYLSVRRSEKEGRINLAKKYFLVDLYRLFKREITEDIFDYEFGNYDKKKELTQFEQFLEQALTEVKGIHRKFIGYKEEIKYYKYFF